MTDAAVTAAPAVRAPAPVPEASGGRVPVLMRIVLALVILVSASHDTAIILRGLGWSDHMVNIGVDPGLKGILTEVATVAPGSIMAQAGVQRGDVIRFDRPHDALRYAYREGEVLGFTLKRGASEEHKTIVVPKVGQQPISWERIARGSLFLLITAIGAMIGLRSLNRRSVFLLGLAIAAYGLSGSFPNAWENRYSFIVVSGLALSAVFNASHPLFLAFALKLRSQTSGVATSRFWVIVLTSLALVQLVFWLDALQMGIRAAPALLDLPWAVIMCMPLVCSCMTMIALFRGRAESRGETRTRYSFLILAFALLLLGGQGTGFYINLTGNNWSYLNPAVLLTNVLIIAGVITFAYAVLRHRVIDLGFAMNRTLVYGILSAILLFAFWFCEWGLEEIIPAETREANILISAGIAFAIFLTFHHVRDWVETVIEHVFFRLWRENEAKLKRFVRDASYITRADALRTAAVAEFRRFSGGSEVALYSLGAADAVLREGGISGLAATLDVDEPALVRLRSDRETLDGDLLAALGASMILPIVQRSEVVGAFILGPKPSGEAWRPDERAVLADAAYRVGLDLHILEIERLEGRVGELDAQLRLVTAQGRAAMA